MPAPLRLLAAPVLAMFLAAPAPGQPAAPAQGAKALPLVLQAKDGFPVAITYYESPAGKESPVVVMLHGKDGNRVVYQKFAEALQAEGIAAVTVDLRGHGESQLPETGGRRRRVPADEHKRMVLYDLPAVKKFLYDKHQDEKLNMRKTGLLAADFSAPLAINFALGDWLAKPYNDAPTLAASTPRGQDVRAIALLSPSDSTTGVTASRPLLQLGADLFNVAFLVVVGDTDQEDGGDAKDFFEKATKAAADPEGKENSARRRMYFREYTTGFRGTDLLGRGASVPVETNVLEFFKLHLKDLQSPWVDREPRI